MTIFGTGIERGHCKHGAKKVNGKGTCIHESCDYYSGFGINDVQRYFGKDSSSVEAARLMRESPTRYREMRAKAVEMQLLIV